MRKLIALCLLSVIALAGAIAYTDIWLMRIIQTYAYGESWITAAHFRQLQIGMSYPNALEVLGRPGKEVSSTRISTATGEAVVTTYSWHNADGSNVILVFVDDQLVEKARIGLQ